MSNENIAVFAQTTFRNEFKKFGIKIDDRRRHMYLIGKTGMGKSTVLENMIIDDIRAGRGVAVCDPHGDLAEKIIQFIPPERINDVVYFNPADMDYPIAFNVVEQVDHNLQHLVASGLIGVFQKLWADSWGPRLEYILRNAILAILDFPGSTLLGVVRMLSDKAYRKQVVANIKDPVVKAFWEKEFAGYADKFASEAVSPIQNKVGQFLSSSLMRNIVGQVKSSIDLREIMDTSKILIMNLSKGRIGEDNSALLGAMMITKIQLAAMSRVDIPEKERKDFYLYIDEFQNFSTDSFANILSEARKYRLDLILAHQYIEQLSEKVKPAVFGNVGTMIAFRVGAADAEELAKEFMPTFNEEDLVNLPKYEMYLKLMIDGIASSPFSAKGLPPIPDDEKTNQEDKVIRASREKYATPRAVVEERIMNWHESSMGGIVTSNSNVVNVVPASSNNASSASNVIVPDVAVKYEPQAGEGYKTNCALCGNVTFTPFEPDGVRPVFCKQCLSKKKEERKAEMDARQGKTAVSAPVQKPTAIPQAPTSLRPPVTSIPKPAPKPNQVSVQVPKKPAAHQAKPVNANKPKHDFPKPSYMAKPQPFRPSSMEAFEVPEKPIATLSLNDLTRAQPLNFKGHPDLIKPKKLEEPEELEGDFSNTEDLGSEVLKNWPSGEVWREGEEIDLNKQNFPKDSDA